MMAFKRTHSSAALAFKDASYACALEIHHLSFLTRVAMWLRGLWSK